ncbi:hypothetical protein LB523_08550 [Mesorhizobium sp. ESP-6-4]|uniref:hypothetical protein n=1 Tax=Mesorhizobium sp. ESP-6-4 TaxID=2876624 RepID=UPI001CC9870C|nr:hypothetical protein [Mesorhizobium sp. ESP-6-4]MBZ9659093.1 hypothetical protein [Mesorhizobium sp. ESP-6-4]
MFSLKLATLAVTALVAWNASPASALTMKECSETYRALNGLRWIQKGGGYYSLCNARLKVES